MIRALLSDGTFLFGVDAENIRRLTNGQPIVIDLTEMGGKDKFAIMYGETIEDIQEQLEEITGEPLPTPMTLDDIRKKQ